MFEYLASLTSLPNLHPALVHFPIVLAMLALALDLAIVISRCRALEHAAVAIWVLAAPMTLITWLSGRAAADSLGSLSAATQAALSDHSDLGRLSLITIAVLALARLALAWIDRGDEPCSRLAWRSLALVAAAMMVTIVAVTADHGGALVYRHGVAVAIQDREPPAIVQPLLDTPVEDLATPERRDPREGLSLQGESLIWEPKGMDSTALETIVEVLHGADRVQVDNGEKSAGLRLRLEGEVLLAFQVSPGDQVMRTKIDASDFRGDYGLVHHLIDRDRLDRFRVGSGGEVALERLDNATLDSMASSTAEVLVSSGPGVAHIIEVSAHGKHLKGLVDGEMVVHGHAAPTSGSRAGLWFDGVGVIELLRVEIEAAESK